MKKIEIILFGPPRSGKSVLAEKLRKAGVQMIVPRDGFEIFGRERYETTTKIEIVCATLDDLGQRYQDTPAGVRVDLPEPRRLSLI
jgi:GTPase SAR1 family protein